MGGFKHNPDDYREESQANIQFGWAYQILEIIKSINQYSVLCARKDFRLYEMFSVLLVLRDMIHAKTNKDLKEIDENVEEIEKMLLKFDKLSSSGMDIGGKRVIRQGFLTYKKLRKLYNDLMEVMKKYGILEQIRMDVKTLARQSWYGDSAQVN